MDQMPLRSRSELQLRTILDNLADGVVTIDSTGTILWANRAIERIFGYAQEELIDANVKLLMPPPINGEHDKYLARYMATGESRILGTRRDTEGRRKDGTIFPLSLEISEFSFEGQSIFTGIVRDLTDEKRLERVEAHLAAIVQSSNDGIISKSTHGTILSWNKGAERIYGYRADEIVGKSIELVVPVELLDELHRLQGRVAAGEHVPQHETRRVRKNGRIIHVSLSLSPIYDGDGNVMGISTISRDISARVRMERDLLSTAVELGRANRELQDFATIASHDLHEPLRKVMILSQRLLRDEEGSLSDAGQDNLRRILDALSRMQTLIDDLLAYARVGADYEVGAPINLNSVVARVLEDLEVLIEQNGAMIEVGELPVVRGIEHQVQQLFFNLLANALKFRHSDRAPRITISRLGAGEGLSLPAGQVGIRVRDNGIGFDKDSSERIFKMFARLHSQSAYPGSGTGLAICRKIAEVHGGSISANGIEGEGAWFDVSLPAGDEDVP